MALAALLGCAAVAVADPGAGSPESYRRPVSATAQIEYCRGLVQKGADAGLLGRCFDHAALLLERGLELRRAAPSASPELERQIEFGVRKLAARLRAFPVGSRDRMDHELRYLDDEIRALRASLSRGVASEGVELSLVSRGGVSLGNWQAGFLYVVTEWAKQRAAQHGGPGHSAPAFSTVTGASAGAVNGLIAAIEGCRGPNLVARDSLYYRVWMDLGLFGRHGAPGLFPVGSDGSTSLSLFTDAAIERTLGLAERSIDSGGELPSCSVDLGFVTTHLDRSESPIHVRQDGTPVLTTRKLKEKFAVRLRTPDATALAGPDTRPVVVTNIGPPKTYRADRIFYAGLGHGHEVPVESLLQGIRASAAFPAAFPPVTLSYTQYVPGPQGAVLPKERVGTFIDGGVLDNTPVGLAVALDAWRRDVSSAAANPYLAGLVPSEARSYLFLEPGVRSWVLGSEDVAPSRTREKDLLKVFAGFATDLLATSMDAQLTNTAEQFPFVRRERDDWTRPRLSVPERNLPITGTQFEHFMAFLERDFRIFDFHVGMADALVYLQREECLLSGKEAGCGASELLSGLDGDLKRGDPLYRCIRAYYDSDAFRVLKRLSTKQLPQECQKLIEVHCDGGDWVPTEKAVRAFLKSRAVATEPEADRCIEPTIANHNFRVLLASMHNYKVWMQSGDYDESLELDQFFDELGQGDLAERFIYVDLPTYRRSDRGYLDARQARRAFRSLLQDGIDRLAKEQPGLDRYALGLGGRAAADIAFEREHPRAILGVGVALNGVELTYGHSLVSPPWRWDSSFRYYRIQEQTYGPNLRPLTSDIYFSSQVTRVFSPTKAIDLELGLGWALSETIAYNSSHPGHVAFRTGPRSLLSLVLFQRLYVAANLDYYPIRVVEPVYEDSANPPGDWQWNVAAGWRFLF